MQTKHTKLVSIPTDIQFTLFLIKEELKSRKLFRALKKAGFTNPYFQPHLDTLILTCVGLDGSSDEIFNRYTTLLEKRSKKIESDNDSIMKQALKVYHELLQEKQKRSAKDNETAK